MTTILILHYAGPPVVGGVEHTIAEHARHLAAAGYTVHIVAGRGQGLPWPGVRFQRLPRLDSRHPQVLEVQRALAQGRVPQAFFALRDAIAQEMRPWLATADLVIAHNVVTLHKNLALTAALYDHLSRADARPLLAWCHDFAWADELYRPALHAGYPWDLLRQPWPRTRYVAVTAVRARTLARLLGLPLPRIAVVPPGVDPAAFYALGPRVRTWVERLGLWDADPLLLLPARITRRKNIGLALRVLAALRHSRPQAALIVTGPPGPHNPANQAYLEELLRLRQDLGLTQAAHFLYRLGTPEQPLLPTADEIAALYRLADALFFPSRREGFGIPVLEAGLARLPAFVADLPELREAGGSDVAVYFDPTADPEVIARQIQRTLADHSLYRQRRRVLWAFRWERLVAERVIPLIEEVLRWPPNT